MKILGNSLHISNSGKLIARSDKTPTPGGLVFDSNKNKIGKVSYVFGPTKKPYISISLFRSANIDRIQKNYGELICMVLRQQCHATFLLKDDLKL